VALAIDQRGVSVRQHTLGEVTGRHPMKILVIAPLPPPTHGQSLASDVIYKALREHHDVQAVNMAKPIARHRWGSLGRVLPIVRVLAQVARRKRGVDRIYLSISESLLGNVKDICIYLLCYRSLDRMFIHLLGGAGMKRMLEKRGFQYRVNRAFISRLKGVIVEGRAQAATFATLARPENIHIVHNFAEDFLFVDEDSIARKFAAVTPLNVLFLSNLLPGKGHDELLEAYLGLRPDLREKVRIVFVGGFESDAARAAFLKRLDGHDALTYLGAFIAGEPKKALYGRTHVFCLPTYYPYEGQPISILEAYATGCVVVTTRHSGIPEVFADAVNGYAVETESAESIRSALEKMLGGQERLVDIALTNRRVAGEAYTAGVYTSALSRILVGAPAS
jgi:glycosyltransferase involved in cell wall biosynthesis